MDGGEDARIYVIPILLRANSDLEDRDYINFIINSIFIDFVNDIINSDKLSKDEFDKLQEVNNCFECTICFENKEQGIKLECNHIFCKDCLEEWLTKTKNTCPVCRKVVVI